MPHFVDTLLEHIRVKGSPVCVGVDPVYERLPAELREDGQAEPAARLEAIHRYVADLLTAVSPHVPAVKFQSACFERYGWEGVETYHSLIQEAKARSLLVIGDVKRGDIGVSAEHYAAGCLSDQPAIDDGDHAAPDAVTIASYFGVDGIGPFLDAAASQGKGVFALVRTSNPGGDAIQSLKLADGRSVAQAVAELVAGIGSDARWIGASGYSLLGAVVGATKPADAAELRRLMPRQLFLVPGFGAQGGGADDVRACFKPDGTGALITASRSVIFAYEQSPADDWMMRVERAAAELRSQIRAILGW
jgi:orotidine-5'-phosphate decarboxylase